MERHRQPPSSDDRAAKNNIAFYNAKQSLDPAVKRAYVEVEIPKLFSALRANNRKIDVTHVFDMLNRIGYLNAPVGSRFQVEIDNDLSDLFPVPPGETRVINVRLRAAHLQSAEAKLEHGASPSPGFKVFDLQSGDRTHTAIAFIGTTSVGPSRDATLGDHIATGAFANANPSGIGVGNAEAFATLLQKKAPRLYSGIDIVIGHSLGSAVAQAFAEYRMRMGYPPPFGFFAGSPHLNSPESPDWKKNARRFLFVQSGQDPIPLGGTTKRSGIEIKSPWGDLPVTTGLTNSLFDAAVTQHGAEPNLLTMARDGESPKPTLRTGTIPGFGTRALDALRPLVARAAFTPTSVERSVERSMALIDGVPGLAGQHVAGVLDANRQLNIQVMRRLMTTELGATALQAHGPDTARLLVETSDAIRENPEEGLKVLGRKLVRLVAISDVTMPAKTNLLELTESVKALLAAPGLGSTGNLEVDPKMKSRAGGATGKKKRLGLSVPKRQFSTERPDPAAGAGRNASEDGSDDDQANQTDRTTWRPDPAMVADSDERFPYGRTYALRFLNKAYADRPDQTGFVVLAAVRFTHDSLWWVFSGEPLLRQHRPALREGGQVASGPKADAHQHGWSGGA